MRHRAFFVLFLHEDNDGHPSFVRLAADITPHVGAKIVGSTYHVVDLALVRHMIVLGTKLERMGGRRHDDFLFVGFFFL